MGRGPTAKAMFGEEQIEVAPASIKALLGSEERVLTSEFTARVGMIILSRSKLVVQYPAWVWD